MSAICLIGTQELLPDYTQGILTGIDNYDYDKGDFLFVL